MKPVDVAIAIAVQILWAVGFTLGKPVVEHHRAGWRKEAVSAYARIRPRINYENRQCGLRATKTVMAAGGVTKRDAGRPALESRHTATRADV